MYANGKKAAVFSTAVTADGATYYTPEKLSLGKLYYEGSTFFGTWHEIALVALWDEILTDQQHFQLHQNPWQLFEPEVQFGFKASAAGITGPLIGARRLIYGGPLIGGRLAA